MRKKYMLGFVTIMALMISSSFSGAETGNYPQEVNDTLEKAGDNRSELEKVLTHYASGNDSLKYQAACYLLGNMEDHCYVTYGFVDTLEDEVPFNALDYSEFDELETAFHALEQNHGELDYQRKDKYPDVETIEANFLIDQIDRAFDVWRRKPWARMFSFDDFLNYILPYRGSNEPLEPWRAYFQDKYDYVGKELENPSDPVEAAVIINNDIKSWFKFDPRYYYHPTDQGLSEMLENKLGRCEDMTNLTIYAMRANGLAVTSDYTPHWANTGNNHAWNAILTPNGKVIPFMGAEANPGEYKLANKAAKVYRKMFAKQPDNLVFQKRKQDKIPRWLGGKNYKDVTSDYVPVTDVTVTFEEEIPDSIDIAYLCVFNSGEWHAIDWGRIKDNSAVFSDLGTGIAYIPALYLNEEIKPYGEPFILLDDNSKQSLKYNENKVTDLSINVVSDGCKDMPVENGQEYELFYWDDGWQSMKKITADDKLPLFIQNIPEGCLYWIDSENLHGEGRIFTVENSQVAWW